MTPLTGNSREFPDFRAPSSSPAMRSRGDSNGHISMVRGSGFQTGLMRRGNSKLASLRPAFPRTVWSVASQPRLDVVGTDPDRVIGVTDDALAVEKKGVWDSLNVVENLHRLCGGVGFPHGNDVGIAAGQQESSPRPAGFRPGSLRAPPIPDRDSLRLGSRDAAANSGTEDTNWPRNRGSRRCRESRTERLPRSGGPRG